MPSHSPRTNLRVFSKEQCGLWYQKQQKGQAESMLWPFHYPLRTECRCMWTEVEVFVKNHSKVAGRFCRVSFDTWKLYRKHRKIFAPLPFTPDDEKFSFIWVQFQFNCRHSGLDRGQPWLKSIQCDSRVALWKGNIQLAVTSIEMVKDRMPRNQATELSGIERNF